MPATVCWEFAANNYELWIFFSNLHLCQSAENAVNCMQHAAVILVATAVVTCYLLAVESLWLTMSFVSAELTRTFYYLRTYYLDDENDYIIIITLRSAWLRCAYGFTLQHISWGQRQSKLTVLSCKLFAFFCPSFCLHAFRRSQQSVSLKIDFLFCIQKSNIMRQNAACDNVYAALLHIDYAQAYVCFSCSYL